MKKILMALSFVILSSGFAMSQGKLNYSGFSGGMMIHSGYLQSGTFELTNANNHSISQNQIKGFPFGIGGAARLHFGKHLRVGGEGYVSDIRYNSNGSYASTSWGGLLVDCIWQFKRFAPFAGLLVGGGNTKNLTLSEKYADDYMIETNTSFREYSFLAIAPFVGVEYAVNSKIRLTLKADYLINLNNPQDDFAHGPRIFLGFMFYRLKGE